MNETMFASMADQMRPDSDVLAGLFAQIEAEPVAGAVPPRPAVLPGARRRVPLPRWWIGLAAAGAAVALMVPAVGSWPVEQRGAGAASGGAGAASGDPEAIGGLDYAALYRAAVAAMARQSVRESAGGAVEDTATGSVKAPVPQPSSGSYQTNVQVAGIDEGDLVKSDGRSIFVASGKKVAIMAADGPRTRQLATIDTSAGAAGKRGLDGYTMQGGVVELELQGTTLVVLVTEYRARTSELPATLPGPATTTMVPFDAALTKALLYDVADPSSPRYLASLGQSGGLVTTRLTGDLLYLVTNYTLADSDSIDPDEPQTFVPVLTQDEKVAATKIGDIGMLPEPSGPTYTVVSSIDLSSRKRVDSQSVLGGTGTVYMSTDNLYLAAANWSPSAQVREQAGAKDLQEASVTQLARIAVADGKLDLAAQGAVPGSVVNQFALDEYAGHLRVVTTVEGQSKKAWVQRAGLFVLNAKLKVVGSISSLVSNESVRSVRFAGPVGYVVTFRQMDPLFAVDLADPAKPRVLSALKIPGFSTYLHPWADGQLLGLGRDATSKGEDRGLKLSMFNTADPLEVSETTVKKFAGQDAEALYDHRAVLVDPADGLIGFAVTDWSGESVKVRYLVFHYDEAKGFVQAGKLPVKTATDGSIPTVRGMVIGDYLYLASAKQVSGYSTTGLDKVADVKVKG
jgi:uncharacterized secreted protein with C-terminal beta-propeller domain